MKKVTKILLSILLVITCSTTMLVGCINTHNDVGGNNNEPKWVSLADLLKEDSKHDVWDDNQTNFHCSYTKEIYPNVWDIKSEYLTKEAELDEIPYNFYEDFSVGLAGKYERYIKKIKMTITTKNDAEMELQFSNCRIEEQGEVVKKITVKANIPQEIIVEIPHPNNEKNGWLDIVLLNLDKKTRNQFVEWKISNVMLLCE